MQKGLLNGLDLFSGYGGITLALSEYSRPIMYCEVDRYAQSILVSRMDDGSLPFAPIWNDVTTLDGTKFRGLVDIVYGGFPCQDISVAGKGAGLEGKRSGLFYEVVRICKEASPQFIFLENVPAIRTRGAIEVQETLSGLGYDSRWLTLSAAEVGANHKRERWFCLAYANGSRKSPEQNPERVTPKGPSDSGEGNIPGSDGEEKRLANTVCAGQSSPMLGRHEEKHAKPRDYLLRDHWTVEPDVGRVVNGVAFRVDRIKALGNGVVPLQVKTAFETLIGIA